jgi:hypothetical protein
MRIGAAAPEKKMKAAALGCAGFCLGAIVGGIIGLGLGFLWTTVFHTTSFEGYSGMLVFFTFMPIGIVVGGMAGGVGLGLIGARSEERAAPTS